MAKLGPCWPGPWPRPGCSCLLSSPAKAPAPLISRRQQPLPIHHSHCLISRAWRPLPLARDGCHRVAVAASLAPTPSFGHAAGHGGVRLPFAPSLRTHRGEAPWPRDSGVARAARATALRFPAGRCEGRPHPYRAGPALPGGALTAALGFSLIRSRSDSSPPGTAVFADPQPQDRLTQFPHMSIHRTKRLPVS